MPILIRHDRYDDRLDSLLERQPARVSRTALVDAMLEAAIEICEQTGNAEAWRGIRFHARQMVHPSGQTDNGDQSMLRDQSLTNAASQPLSDSASRAND